MPDDAGGQPGSALTGIFPEDAMTLRTTAEATEADVSTCWLGDEGTGRSVADGSPGGDSIRRIVSWF